MKSFLPFPKQKHSLKPLFFLMLLAALTLFACGAMAQAPAVTYRGALGLYVTAPLTPLSPQNTGGAVTMTYPANPVAIATIARNLNGGVADKAGNIYITSQISVGLFEVSNGNLTVAARLPAHPTALAADTAGNIYVGVGANIEAYRDGTFVNIYTLSEPVLSLAIDPAGNFYAASNDPGNGAYVIYKISHDGSAITTFTETGQPFVVCTDRSGNVFFEGFDGYVYEMPVGSSTPVSLMNYVDLASAMTTDGAGNVYLTDAYSSANITRLTPSTGVHLQLNAVALNTDAYLVVDANDNLYYSSPASGFGNTVLAESPASYGYTVSPSLPLGLNLDRITGVLSGTPLMAVPATNYTITAANSSGSSNSVIRLQTAQVNTIFYTSTAQAYNQNTAINPLVPNISGQPGGAVYNTPTIVATGFTTPVGVTADASGNVYVADNTQSNINEIVPAGGNPTGTGSGLSSPAGVVADAAGNLFVADAGNGAIKEVLHSDGSVQTLVSGLSAPQAITRDPAGNLFFVNSTTVFEIKVGQSTATTLVSGLVTLSGIAVDAGDNLYVTSQTAGKVYKIAAGSTTAADMGVALSLPAGIAMDAAGNLWVAASGTHALYEIAAGSGAATLVSDAFMATAGVAAGSDGRIYVTDSSAGKVFELVPDGGIYLSQQLPLGLVMDPATGIISGTPLLQSASANYTPTIYTGLVPFTSNPFTISVGPPLIPPAISYENPPAYPLGVAITPLLPTNTGNPPTAITYNGTPRAISFAYANTNQQAEGIALDDKGNIYVTDFANGHQVLEYTNVQVTQLGSGFNLPKGIVADKAGSIYFTDRTVVYKMVPGGTATVIANFTEADAIAIDTNGSLYVADQGNGGSNPGGIFKMNTDGSNKTNITAGVQNPSLVAVDSLGNVFAYVTLSQTLYKIAAGTGQQTTVSNSIQNAQALAADKNGNVYFAAQALIQATGVFNNNVYVISSGGGTPQLLVTVGINNTGLVAGLATDGANNLYIAYANSSNLDEVDIYARTGGYSISPALPAGLTFDNNTGIINGTPTATSPATTYTVTALNSQGSSTAPVTIQVGPPPAISYGGPETYTVNTVITALSPSSTGAAITAPGYNASPAPAVSGLNAPGGISVDAAGKVYVADKANNAVKVASPSAGNPAVIGSGFKAPSAVVVDNVGNVYVADTGNGAVAEIPAGNGAVQTIATGLTGVRAIACDTAGNLFAANATTIYEVAAGQTTAVTLAPGLGNVTGIAVDRNDNLYVTSAATGKVYKIKVGDNTPVDLGLSFTAPSGVAVDAAGSLFITDSSNHALYQVTAGSSTATLLTASFNTPVAVASGRDGRVYVTDAAAGQVFEIAPTGGFYLSQALPQGLTMDAGTGAITGTPKKGNAATNYSITAYANGIGIQTPAVINITVNAAPALPAISYQNPPAYAPGTAISALSPANTGGAVTTPSWGPPASFGPTIEYHVNMAADSKGDVWVCNQSGAADAGIIEIPADGSPAVQYTNSNEDGEVAVDSTGNVYFVRISSLNRIGPGGGSPTPFGPGGLFVFDVAVDPAGNVFAPSAQDLNIYKITPGGSASVVYSFPSSPGLNCIAVDAQDNIFMGYVNSGVITERIASTGNVITIATGVNPQHLAVDNAGNLYETEFGAHVVNMIPVGGTIKTVVGTGNFGLAVDGSGTLYFDNSGFGQIMKASPTGGYVINHLLPAGLSFSSTTGIISGTPTAASPTTVYKIAGYNSQGSSVASLTITSGQPPVISYSGPQTYSLGTAISPLSPTASGPVVTAAGYNAPVVLNSSLGSPQQIAVDAAGNIYVADKAKNVVTKIPAGGGAGVCIGATFKQPSGIAADKSGNVYVADAGNAAVKEIPAAGGFMTTIGSGFTAPSAVALDTPGNIYIADVTTIYKVTPGGVQTTVTTGFNNLTAIAISPDNKSLYATDASGAVYRVIISKSPVEAVALGVSFTSPAGIAMDNAGNLYVADAGARQVYEIAAGQAQSVSLGLPFSVSSSPSGVAVDNSGNIYFADAGTGQVSEIIPSGGFYLNNPLPEGLLLNSSTGVISGTPKTASAAADYGVTAYAGSIPGQATVNITVTGGVPPTFAYEGVPALALGVPIIPVSPVVTSGGIGQYAYNGAPAIVGVGVTATGKIAVDSLGNVYIADMPDNSVAEIFSSGGLIRLASFINHPNGITKDRQNNVWIANGQIVETINQQVSLGNYQNPVTVGSDFANNIYVGDIGLGGVYRMDKNGNNQVKIDHGIAHPDALAADAAGDVYVVSSVADSLYVIQANGGAQRAIAHFNTPTQIAVDPFGDVFVAENAGYIYFVPAGGGTPLLLNQTPYANLTGIGVDGKGDLFVGQSNISGVNKLTPTGGYFQNGGLPAGLVLDHTTGIISGTPTTVWAQPPPLTSLPVFTVNGFNASGSGTATLNVQIGAPPAFSYSSPQTLYKGISGQRVSPVNTGTTPVASWGYNTLGGRIVAETLNTGGITVDASGNIYVADKTGNMILKYPPSGASVCVGTGFNSPAGMAVDGAGNLFVADQGNSVVKKIPAGGGIIQTIGSGFSSPATVAADGQGNLYIGDGNKVYKIAAGTGAQSVIATISYTITGMAADFSGNVYIAGKQTAGQLSNQMIKIPAGTSSPTVLTITPPDRFVAVSPIGDLYYFDFNSGGSEAMVIVPAGATTSNFVDVVATSTSGLFVDGAGNVYYTELSPSGFKGQGITKAIPSGGYFINQPLPQGLSLDQNTGAISGVPQAFSTATNYTITGYATGATASATINLNVAIPSPDATLANLVLDGNAMSPAFQSSTLSYSATVSYSTASVTVTPTLNNAGATVTVNGQNVTSGVSSQSLTLAYGNNTITVKATAQDQVTTKTYTITVNRQLAPETITFNSLPGHTYGDPDFAPGATSDNNNVAIAYSSDNLAVARVVNGNIHIVGAGTANITASQAGDASHNPAINVMQQLSVAQANLTITADNQNSTYGGAIPTLTASYSGFAYSDNAVSLATPPSLSATGTSASPVGPYTITASGAASPNYAISYAPGILTIGPASLTITADNKSMIAGQQAPALTASYNSFVNNDGPGSLTTPLVLSTTATSASAPGQYAISASGATDANYNISYVAGLLTVNPSSDAGLSAMRLSRGVLSPAFSTANTAYTVNVANNVTSITISPVTTNGSAGVTVNGASAATPVSIPVGQTFIPVVVTAQDGHTTEKYTVTVDRAPSANDNLSSLKMSKGIFSPVFANSITSYTDAVGNTISSVTVTPTTADPTATVKVNGTTVTSGMASDPVNLNIGPNPIYVAVTAQNGTTKTDTITVTRPPSTNNNLVSLKMSKGIFSPTFTNGVTSYTDAVGNTITSVTVTPTTADPTATVKVNGTTVTSGTASDPVNLNIGPNPVYVTVTAQNGTAKTDTITVTRPPSTNNNLVSLKMSKGIFSPTFTNSITSYIDAVGNTITSVTVTPTTADPTAAVTVNGKMVSSGTASDPINLDLGPNPVYVTVTAQNGTTKTDTVMVTRAPLTNDNLSSLKMSKGIFSPRFSTATTSYTDAVANTITSVTVTPTTADPTATIKVNGAVLISGTASDPIILSVGATPIYIAVTAQDGVTTKTDTVTVTRAPGGADGYGPGISVTIPIAVGIAEDGVVVHQGISPNGDGINDFLQIDNISQYPNNKLSIMNRNGQLIYEASGYDNSSKVFDGHSNKNGQMQLPGTYFYQLDYTVSGITKHKTGFLVLKY